MATEPWPAHTAGAETRTCSDERWQLMWSHREHLLKVARRRSVSVEDAEDAVHEAMLRAMENPRLDHDRLAAWLTTVTVRLCVDRHRQVNREAEVGSRTTYAAPLPATVEDVVCDRDEATWLAQRSGELPGRQAEALWLKSEDLDVGQVARRMGLSYRTVESLLARARRTLRNSLAGTLALALWLCGRGRPRSGGAMQSAAVVSTAATLTVLGIAVPGVYDGTGPAPPRAAAERAGEPRPVAYRERAAQESDVSRPRAGEGRPYGTAGAGVVELPRVPLPALTSLESLRVAGGGDVARIPPLARLLGLPRLSSARSAPSVPGVPPAAGLSELGEVAGERARGGGVPQPPAVPGLPEPSAPPAPSGGDAESGLGEPGSGARPDDGADAPTGADAPADAPEDTGGAPGPVPDGESLPDVPSGTGDLPAGSETSLP